MKALKVFEKENFKEGIEAALNDLFLAYRFLCDLSKAKYYFNLLPQRENYGLYPFMLIAFISFNLLYGGEYVQ